MTDQIILVEALHDEHDSPGLLVIEPGHQRVVVELGDPPPRRLGESVEALERVIDDDQVGTPSQYRAADARREAGSLPRRLEFEIARPPGQSEGRKHLAIPWGLGHGAPVDAELPGEVLG